MSSKVGFAALAGAAFGAFGLPKDTEIYSIPEWPLSFLETFR